MFSQSDVQGGCTIQYGDTVIWRIESHSRKGSSGAKDHYFGFVDQEQITLQLETAGERLQGKVLSGELFYIPCNTSFKLLNKGPQAAELVMIRFQCTGGPLLPEIKVPSVFHFRMPQGRQWSQDFLRVVSGRETGLYYQLQSHLYRMAAYLAEAQQQRADMEPDKLTILEQSRAYILDHYNEAVDIEELARSAGGSPSWFYQAFRKHSGLSPHKFVTTARLNTSLNLLAAQTYSVMEVAHAVGYADELYFSRLFKKHMGISPTDYAQHANVRIACLSPVFEGDLSVLGLKPALQLARGWMDDPWNYMEQIAASSPDIIFASPLPEGVLERLQTIAPVVMLHWKRYSWKEKLLRISASLQLQTVAERWLSYYDLKVENARAHIRQHLKGQPFLLVGAYGDAYRVFGLKLRKIRDLFYEDMHMTPPKHTEQISFLESMPLADIAQLGCDNVLFLVAEEVTESQCYQLEREWRRLRGMGSKGTCLFVRHAPTLLYNASVHERLIDRTVQCLIQHYTSERKIHGA